MRENLWVSDFERRFTATYIAALSVLAAFAIFSQLAIFYQLRQRDTAAHMIDVSARQGMLGQRLAKMALEARESHDTREWREWRADFADSLWEWERVHAGLRSRDNSLGIAGENGPEVQAAFERLSPRFELMRIAAHKMLDLVDQDGHLHGPGILEPWIQQIMESSEAYVHQMDAIVTLYEHDALTRGTKLQIVQTMFPTGTLALLVLLAFLLFRPAGKKMRETVTALRESERRFHAFIDNSPLVSFMKDEQGRYVFVNEAVARIFRAAAPDIIGKTDADFLDAETARKLRENDIAVLADNRSAQVVEIVKDERGDTSHWLTLKFPFVNREGRRFLGGNAINITERVRAEEAMRASEKRWQLALRGSNDGLWDWNALTGEVYISARWKQMLGYADNEIPNLSEEWERRVHPDDLARVKTDIAAHLARETPYYVSEYRMQARDGSWKWVLARGQGVWDERGRPLRMAGSHTDITDRKRAEEQLSYEAAYDPLTQLSNRRRLIEQIEVAFVHAQASGEPLSICLCDVDRFKQVNDDGGHSMGDRVLSTFAQLVREELPERGMAGRLGGDEFCILLPGFTAAQAGQAMERLRVRLESMLFAQRDGVPLHVTATFGIAAMEGHRDEASLMDAADHALYEGKRAGRNRVAGMPPRKGSASAVTQRQDLAV